MRTQKEQLEPWVIKFMIFLIFSDLKKDMKIILAQSLMENGHLSLINIHDEQTMIDQNLVSKNDLFLQEMSILCKHDYAKECIKNEIYKKYKP